MRKNTIIRKTTGATKIPIGPYMIVEEVHKSFVIARDTYELLKCTNHKLILKNNVKLYTKMSFVCCRKTILDIKNCKIDHVIHPISKSWEKLINNTPDIIMFYDLICGERVFVRTLLDKLIISDSSGSQYIKLYFNKIEDLI